MDEEKRLNLSLQRVKKRLKLLESKKKLTSKEIEKLNDLHFICYDICDQLDYIRGK